MPGFFVFEIWTWFSWLSGRYFTDSHLPKSLTVSERNCKLLQCSSLPNSCYLYCFYVCVCIQWCICTHTHTHVSMEGIMRASKGEGQLVVLIFCKTHEPHNDQTYWISPMRQEWHTSCLLALKVHSIGENSCLVYKHSQPPMAEEIIDLKKDPTTFLSQYKF